MNGENTSVHLSWGRHIEREAVMLKMLKQSLHTYIQKMISWNMTSINLFYNLLERKMKNCNH